ncbi:UDP-N-acetylglucosamine--N-acetylmuramyl-(pentapeptide) pyrophosphoryl-undecaprenol N-acetylglucosamine transferase [Bacillus mesophilus]|uniref:UDP-N-acetylglucosamine--N-acetylmuramyl-(pentapeptide) pyrophosphoryl-undecaprenol N-acetylglucosamine transferase n=1 Tax=Bacillus mesophilus TaxID=1808955 RepID=A0A6M0Q5D7_9BACI|nr:undecaprenyldiphospho-muramoylpentapeptide beta-N-acetylglucosaminyltransferase [Bacillus mesophilus]MBM7659455.1 UDP-N-acetylglucosamine--N-acetylmuramyl-(pentapeptide) pyrophosphoryl-undecaprenol N-acetylglucosamine transferase [Bacillus mesophilus]NEY70328.1 undecaprenyldiphospho-muramoylpentapeptide beta-N-acetylglucosaminyltransferase [Bacillus mesophilus]
MKVLISGGGTGGHIYPALALIKEIKKQEPSASFLYMGTELGLENKIISQEEDIPFKAIHITGFKRKVSIENIKTIYRFLKGVHESKKVIKSFRPDIVIGTGGYVCGPVVYAAAKLKVPTVIHEQNSVPGLTNKFLSRYVDQIAICFKEALPFFPSNKVKLTGNPRASEVIQNQGVDKEMLGLNPNKKTVLIVGGSRGARPINDTCIAALPQFKQQKYEVLYITGEIHYDKVKEEIEREGNPTNIIVKPFLHNMPDYLQNVDLIVARAGATTLAEITALGVPSILIPSPYVTNNHQEKNAASLEKNGAAVLLRESELSGETLLHEIHGIVGNEAKWKEMKGNAIELGIPDAADKLYQLIKKHTK